MIVCMVDFIPAFIFVLGLVAIGKPEWVAAIDRRQKAAGTTRRASDIEMSETYYAFIRIAGIGFALFGFVFTVRSW